MDRRWLGISTVAAALWSASPSAVDHPVFTSLQAIARSPDAFANRAVRTIGRFRGRALADDSPALLKPLRSRWDFLLTWDSEAVWVSGLRRVGRDFDLDPASPADARSGHWLEVIGTVRVDRRHTATGSCRTAAPCPRVWIEATDMQSTAPPWGIAMQIALKPVMSQPVVVFHDPIDDEQSVERTTRVRLQFSRHMAGETFSERVRVSYASPRPIGGASIPSFTAEYVEDRRGLEIRFSAPLAGGETVKVELLDGIRARDGRKLAPYALTFTTEDGL